MATVNRWRCTVLVALSVVLLCGFGQVQAQALNSEDIIAAAEETALATFDGMSWNFWGRYWGDGVFWAGVADLTTVSDDADILDGIRRMGARVTSDSSTIRGEWELFRHSDTDPNHADDMAIAQSFLSYYGNTSDPNVIANTIVRLDQATAMIMSDEAAALAAQAQVLGTHEGLTWSWCDALFMAAPVHAQLSAVTGDPKYLDAMHVEWQRTSSLLYDTEEHLFYRDKSFIGDTTANGEKVFWSRGNGWVMGAFARMLPFLPEDDPYRAGYITQFQEMAAKLASLQRPDGTWSPSLLDYEDFPYAETSGTALDCFAIAWGINNGLLDEETYRPIVEAAWAALMAARLENGDLGSVQGVGDEPAAVNPDQRTWYGNGAFLMAAVEVSEMAAVPEPSTVTLLVLGGAAMLRRRRSAWKRRS